MATHRQHPFDSTFNSWPQMVNESAIPGAEPVMPHASSDICTHVGVEFWFFNNSAGQVIVEPPAIGMLDINKPLVSPLGILMQASDVKSDCGFNMVPRIAVTVFEPRNHSVVEL